ncbi:MAG: hypothetical protein ACLUNS_10490 [Alistipes shahii]
MRLAAGMSRLGEVVLVGNRDLFEIRDLQAEANKSRQHTRP